MWITFRAMLVNSFRDRITLWQSLIFPIGLLIGLGIVFKGPAYRAQLLMGVVSFCTVMCAMMGTPFEILKQRRQGVYKVLKATPFKISSFVTAFTLARGLFCFVPPLIVYTAGVVGFGMTVSAVSVLLVLGVMTLCILCFAFFGVLIGNLAGNETQVAGMNNLSLAPMLFTSEAFYSLANAPEWIRVIGKCLPMSYFVDAMRAAFASDLAALGAPVLVLFGWTAFGLLLAVLTFRWDHSAPVRISLGKA